MRNQNLNSTHNWALWALAAIAIFTSSTVFAQKPGPFVRMVRHDDGSRTVTALDEYAKEQFIETYDAQNVLRLKRVYQLNRLNQPETFVIYDGLGKPHVKGQFLYNNRDQVSEERLYSMDGKPMRRLIHTYDPLGHPGDPKVESYAALPPLLTQWLDPDAGGDVNKISAQGPGLFNRKRSEESEPKKGNFFTRLFGGDKKKKKN